jgi:predicted metalloprotease
MWHCRRSPEQIADALTAAKAIGDERYRAHALGLLAPQLSRDQIADALTAAKAIGDKRYRAHALEKTGSVPAGCRRGHGLPQTDHG